MIYVLSVSLCVGCVGDGVDIQLGRKVNDFMFIDVIYILCVSLCVRVVSLYMCMYVRMYTVCVCACVCWMYLKARR